MKHFVLIFLPPCCWRVPYSKQAKGGWNIQLNKNILQPGDSLLVTVTHKDGGGQTGKRVLATLEVIIENDQGLRNRLRWPVINGQASGALYLPDSLAHGKYTLVAGLQTRSFEVIGEIQDAGNTGSIQAMLLTKTGEWAEQKIPVAPDALASVTGCLKKCMLVFPEQQNKNR